MDIIRIAENIRIRPTHRKFEKTKYTIENLKNINDEKNNTQDVFVKQNKENDKEQINNIVINTIRSK